MYILGICAYLCDSSAALLKDGELLGAIEEEKLVGTKHTGELPVEAIRYLLDREGITLADVHHVAYFFEPWMSLPPRLFMILKNLPGSLGFYGSHGGTWMNMVRVNERLKRAFGLKKVSYVFHNVRHHLCHAASSFFMSDFEDAALLTVDGAGEWENTLMAVGHGCQIQPIGKHCFPNSLGYLYASVTQYLGFKPNSGEGKVMGLASYGKPEEYRDIFHRILKMRSNGEYAIDMSFFDYHQNAASIYNSKRWVSQKFIDTLGSPRTPESSIDVRHKNIASSLQEVFNEVLLHMMDYLHEKTKMENVCLAGGVALNSVANGYAFKRSKFKKIYIQPAAGDGGTSLGAALYVYHSKLNQPRFHAKETVFLGPAFDEEGVIKELNRNHLSFEKVDPVKEGARLLSEGKILGWFQGGVEYGPRALGNRSILADPRIAEMKDILNARVKFRESFRPFAPSILEEKLGEYFDSDYPSPVMLLVYDVLPEKRSVIPAVTHVDGTGRVQSVSRRDNALYYDLISEFYKRTGVPVILNTSFNIRGKPIVCSPGQALECFLKTDMDYLFIGNLMIPSQRHHAKEQFHGHHQTL